MRKVDGPDRAQRGRSSMDCDNLCHTTGGTVPPALSHSELGSGQLAWRLLIKLGLRLHRCNLRLWSLTAARDSLLCSGKTELVKSLADNWNRTVHGCGSYCGGLDEHSTRSLQGTISVSRRTHASMRSQRIRMIDREDRRKGHREGVRFRHVRVG